MKNREPDAEFLAAKSTSISELARSQAMGTISRDWIAEAASHRYTYLFSALGRPIIQFPQDMIALSELIWDVRPNLIIETGVAHGGSLIHSASQLAILDVCDAIESGVSLNPLESTRKVIGIDIDIRSHNRSAIESHPMSSRISMLEGSSIDPRIVDQVHEMAAGYECVMVLLDSNHTHDHVLRELEAYAHLTSVGSYCVVFDTVIEYMPPGSFPDRQWDLGDNPMTAVRAYLETHPEFVIDRTIADKLQITVAPDGYLKKVQKPQHHEESARC